jgi:hypothetical protein
MFSSETSRHKQYDALYIDIDQQGVFITNEQRKIVLHVSLFEHYYFPLAPFTRDWTSSENRPADLPSIKSLISTEDLSYCKYSIRRTIMDMICSQNHCQYRSLFSLVHLVSSSCVHTKIMGVTGGGGCGGGGSPVCRANRTSRVIFASESGNIGLF